MPTSLITLQSSFLSPRSLPPCRRARFPLGFEDSRSRCGVKSKVRRQKAKVKTAERRGRQRTEEGRQRGGGVKSKGKSQRPRGKTAGDRRQARREVALVVLLVQVAERGLERLLLIDLLRGLEQVLLRALGQGRE